MFRRLPMIYRHWGQPKVMVVMDDDENIDDQKEEEEIFFNVPPPSYPTHLVFN